jgi:cobalt-zinc-cadmium efflux system protein
MSHSHAHNHSHSHGKITGRNLLISIFLNLLITASQVIGGILSGSLALLSDALHNFSDVLSLVISYLANKLSKRKASSNRTFGFKRAEIIAAFVNAATLIIVAILLIIEAVKRFQNPKEISSELVIWLSLLGIIANGLSVLLLKNDASKNMNMKSAYLHLLTDMLASIAVLIGGLLMKFYGIFWIDSVLTLAIAIYLIWVGYDLLKDSLRVLMLFTPQDMEVKEIVADVCKIAGIKNMHHVHIWQLNEDEVHLEAHIDFTDDIKLSQFDAILNEIEDILYNDYHINHINIQPEYGKCDAKDIIVQD